MVGNLFSKLLGGGQLSAACSHVKLEILVFLQKGVPLVTCGVDPAPYCLKNLGYLAVWDSSNLKACS